jgi:hypothetical protein
VAQLCYGPLKSPAPDTASQADYNTGTRWQPNRRTYQAATAATEGDQRVPYGQGRPSAKDASGSGANWEVGTTSNPTGMGLVSVESRLEFQGTVNGTDESRATDVREKERMGIYENTLSYAGSYGRVTSEAIGRDLNPLGRGDAVSHVAGWLRLGSLSAPLPFSNALSGQGNSVNNPALVQSHLECCKCLPKIKCGCRETIELWQPGDPIGLPDSSCCPNQCGSECADQTRLLNPKACYCMQPPIQPIGAALLVLPARVLVIQRIWLARTIYFPSVQVQRELLVLH